MSHAAQYLSEAKQVIDGLNIGAIERMADLLVRTRQRGGRLFILGVGGSAANASHAVNDFRKIAGIEAYAPTDNVSELTARTNDEGWATIFVEWLRVSRLRPEDLIFVLSVGGGNLEKNVSPNLVTALQYAQEVGTPVIGIVGQGRRLHGQGGGGLRDRADGQPRAHHAALRGVSGGGLAPAGLASPAQGPCRPSGSPSDEPAAGRRRAPPCGLPRSRRRPEPGDRPRRPPVPPQSPEAFEILPGVAEAVRRLHDAGFLLIVATNQPDVARGTQRREVVEAMNARLLAAMPIDEIRVCYEDGDDCPRRKPNPGLLLEAAQAHGIDLPESYMVGDRWRDVEAGRRAGCRTVFIDLDYDERRPAPPADHDATGLPDAADWILSHKGRTTPPSAASFTGP